MKTAYGFHLLLAVAISLMVCGCSVVVFRNGLPASQPLKPDKALLGYWGVEGASIVCTARTNGLMDVVIIEQSGDGVKATVYESYSAKVGGAQYLCLRPVKSTDEAEKPEHSDGWLILNYRTGWRSVAFRTIRAEAISELIDAGKLKGEVHRGTNAVGTLVSVTASSKDLADLFASLGADAIFETDEWVKIRRAR